MGYVIRLGSDPLIAQAHGVQLSPEQLASVDIEAVSVGGRWKRSPLIFVEPEANEPSISWVQYSEAVVARVRVEMNRSRREIVKYGQWKAGPVSMDLDGSKPLRVALDRWRQGDPTSPSSTLCGELNTLEKWLRCSETVTDVAQTP
ncbi:hypothetical protein PR002_g29556 [Phytophthora rubi]|uniref:Uncharacterized protein n=1 Tax=Phytophthora rubi TaxID=129364 RepID=A0A6A3GZQ0_9STRA|nr:hypothetical protein PR002_g29556 [Phytophthora rubi]